MVRIIWKRGYDWFDNTDYEGLSEKGAWHLVCEAFDKHSVHAVKVFKNGVELS